MMTTTPPYFFVLGAPDHEMQEIARVCAEEGLPFAFATVGGSVVHSYEAYDADGVTRLVSPKDHHIVFVECAVMGLPVSDIIDHHQSGDPGFGKCPEDYLEGSSLGQFLAMIGKDATHQQRLIAAADHCLTAAYQGLCPGVDPEELRAWREQSRSKARGLPVDELRRQIDRASDQLRGAPRVVLDGTPVAWFESEPPYETSEASARLALPYMYVKKQDNGRMKAGIRSAPPAVVDYWIRNCGLQDVYGDPQRGFAGGYH